jgi:hypothetical protein
MAKSAPSSLFIPAPVASRRVLILSKFLYSPDPQVNVAHITWQHDSGPEFDAAHAIIKKWADMERKGLLKKKETSFDKSFLNDIFGAALRYLPVQNAVNGEFTLDHQLFVPGIGPVDGAVGFFPLKDPANPDPVAVIELKGADTDLDTDKSNGRTAVQQLFDYLNGLPKTNWGIVSNFSTIRLYRKGDSQAYESFSLQKLATDLDHFKAFWCLLEKGGLLPSAFKRIPRADDLLTRTGERQKEVGDDLYNHYSSYRSELIAALQQDFNKSLDEAIRIAQKIFDRIIFVAFCEDRGLITERSIRKANEQVPAFTRIKNPRWQNFLGLFRDIDQGNAQTIGVAKGYNGGLFADDPTIDNLDLPDLPWTNAFEGIAKFDFRDEVNVDVLGHIFERSITELEKKRVAGVFGPATALRNAGILPASKQPKMQKSAERKRFGIYYTPPEFTKFIVNETIGELLRQRFADLEKAHGVTPQELADDFKERSPRLQAYYQQCLHVLRSFKVVDPACGSGAFLIAAYEILEDFYYDVAKHLVALGVPDADKTLDQIPDFILKDNLYGVDLSEEAVEISRLALWIRSARPGKTLADLTRNVVCGNSLVDDINVHPRAMTWQTTFPDVFRNAGILPANPNEITARQPGFDAVIGNPPWERIKLQEREFFAFAAPEIASAVSAATRRKLIEKLEKQDPDLYARYIAAQSAAEKTSEHVRSSGRFPLTAKGDINTYMLFAELAHSLVAPSGRVGLLVPSGIATDKTTKEFFNELMESETLHALYDFVNRLGLFEDVEGRLKFCILLMGGWKNKAPIADFVFFAETVEELSESNRHINLSQKDLKLFNPNTGTCPVFRSRKDAQITKRVYNRVPILIDETRQTGGNPWGAKFVRMFDQTNDAELFLTPKELQDNGLKLIGNRWRKGKEEFLPLYEAKMTRDYDHRATRVVFNPDNWYMNYSAESASLVEHQNPEYLAMGRWWVADSRVQACVEESAKIASIAFHDIARSTDTRTMVACMLPWAGATNKLPLILNPENISWPLFCCLLGNLNSHPYDFIARQKVGGANMNFFIVEQLPTLAPDAYHDKCPWHKKQTLEQWISERVLKLTCTANDMIPLAKACNFNPKGDKAGGGIPYVWKWKEQERAELRAQLDAAYFHLYGISRDDAAYILSTFQTSGCTDQGNTIAPHSTAELILSYFDEYAKT